MLTINTYPDPILLEQAKPVEKIDRKINKLIDEMAATMYANEGVGLAAPQVGISKQIIVLDGGEGLISLINPEIIQKSDSQESLEEGCLSLPDVRIEVTRPTEITVTGINEEGDHVEYHAKGLLARIFQHEIDHLNGKLIIDYTSSLTRSLIRSKLKKMEKEV